MWRIGCFCSLFGQKTNGLSKNVIQKTTTGNKSKALAKPKIILSTIGAPSGWHHKDILRDVSRHALGQGPWR